MATKTDKQITDLESQIADVINTIQTKGSSPKLRAERERLRGELRKLKESETQETQETQDTTEAQKLFEEYGYAYGLIESDPSLQKLFQQFLKEGSTWTAKKVESLLRTTDWFKNSNQAKRNYEILRTGDPGEFEDKVKKTTDAVLEQARLTGAKITQEQARGFAEQVMQGGISAIQLPKLFATTFIDFNNADLAGRAGALQDRFTSLNNTAGKVLNSSQINNYVQRILTNEILENDAIDAIRRASASKYSRFSDRIIAGEDLQDIATPWKTIATNLLEVEDVDLDDNLMLDALTSNKYESLADFKRAVKKDPRWQKTNNARSEYFNIGQTILRDFGFLG
jgi:hypothetical protein